MYLPLMRCRYGVLSIATAFWIVVCASVLACGAADEPWSTSAAGDDGRVRVTVSLYRDTIAPGEFAQIRATTKSLVGGPLQLPQGNHQPLAFLYLKTPAGNVFVHPESGVSPKSCRALELADYRRSLVLKKKIEHLVIAYDIPMVNPSPSWLDTRTLEPALPNLRKEGVYEAWVKYTIPMVEGAPADAWHGRVETDRVRFNVRRIPVAARRAEATTEQISHLEAYMKYVDDIFSGKASSKEPAALPEVVEMPQWMSLAGRLQWALERTENEGFARYTVALLRQHQAKTESQQYPKWWGQVNGLLKHRALFNRGYGKRPLKILGPYLDEYALVVAHEIERELAGLTHGRSPATSVDHLNLLLNYVEHAPQSPIRQRLEKLGKRHAKIPEGAKRGDRKIRDRLNFSWTILYTLGLLRDGMPLAEAKALLGQPAEQQGDVIIWNYETGSRKIAPGIVASVTDDGQRQTVAFTNRDAWKH